MNKSRSHEEATIRAFHDDPDFFIRYVRDVLQDLEPRLDRLEAQQATLMEIVKTLTARPPAVPLTARDRFEYPTYPPSGQNFNPWTNQKWSSGATPQMFGMKEKGE